MITVTSSSSGISIRITVFKTEDSLKGKEWAYVYNGAKHKFILDSFYEKSRKTFRNRWDITDRWERLDKRSNTIEHPLTDNEVQAIVIKEFVETIDFELEYFKNDFTLCRKLC